MDLNDYEFWLEYTKSIKKLKNRNVVPRQNIETHRFIELPKSKVPNVTIPLKILPVYSMNKKEKRKFQEEAKIDLHGFTRDRIFKTLESFCAKCIAVNIRNVVIITGKGDGVVKKEAMQWISSSSSYVISFFPIHDSKKEVGSFAIRLRKL